MLDAVTSWIKFSNKNSYYHQQIHRLIRRLVPSDASVLEVGSIGGELINSLPNVRKTGLEVDKSFYNFAKKRFPKVMFINNWSKLGAKKFDYILIPHALATSEDVQGLIHRLKKHSYHHTRVIVLYFNFFWKPVIDLGEKLGLKRPEKNQPNWLTNSDVDNLFFLESFSKVCAGKDVLIPIDLGKISVFFNQIIAKLPIIDAFNLINFSIYAPNPPPSDYSVSVIIPARNESGNMKGVLKKLPNMGKKAEVIFVEGGSTDDTYLTIKNEIASYNGPLTCKLIKQHGKGKGDAVRAGFSKAKNELLMILDADLTVDPSELPKFYSAISRGLGEFVMGSRLVYPMEQMAMRNLNFIGNKFFGLTFSFLLSQHIRDTLCGTKVIRKSDYLKIQKNRHYFGNFDPFGDFDLIFGAAKQNLRILEIPIRYKQRTYGQTNISRFSHGLLLFRMVLFAARKIKFV